MGLGANVEVAVGGIVVAGSEVEVGWGLGEGVTCTWQAPNNMLISKMKLTRLKGIDLEQAELSIHPPKQVIFHALVWLWFREALHKTINGSAEEPQEPGTQTKGLLPAALAGVAGGCPFALFQDWVVIDFDMHRKGFRGDLNQVNIPVAPNPARVFTLEAHPENRKFGA